MEKASTILKKSLKFFGPKGQRWWKGEYSNRPGVISGLKITTKGVKLCSLAVINEFGIELSRHAAAEAETLLRRAAHIKYIDQWNDDPKRKFSEVKAAFLKAIKLAEQQEKGRTRSVRK